MTKATKRKYKFSWDVIGSNLSVSRPSLGSSTRVEVYRLFQYTLRDVIEQHYGADTADRLFREAGVIAGKSFFEQFCKDATDFSSLAKIVQTHFKELGIGVFRIEAANNDEMSFTLTIDEDLDCSGLPEESDEICVYDEGFIQGIFEAFSGKGFVVREVDCWCTGARTCRFNAKATS